MHQKRFVVSVLMKKASEGTMWQAFATAVKKCLHQADIVHDRFHISKYLNDADDQVRRQESGQLKKIGDTTLVGSKFS